jgi:hypothetical protein
VDREWQAADIGASLQSKRRVPVLNVENVCTQATLTYKEHRSGAKWTACEIGHTHARGRIFRSRPHYGAR